MDKIFTVEKKCAYCKGQLDPNAHPQTRGAWCCEPCFDKVMKKIADEKLKEGAT